MIYYPLTRNVPNQNSISWTKQLPWVWLWQRFGSVRSGNVVIEKFHLWLMVEWLLVLPWAIGHRVFVEIAVAIFVVTTLYTVIPYCVLSPLNQIINKMLSLKDELCTPSSVCCVVLNLDHGIVHAKADGSRTVSQFARTRSRSPARTDEPPRGLTSLTTYKWLGRKCYPARALPIGVTSRKSELEPRFYGGPGTSRLLRENSFQRGWFDQRR